MALHFTESEFSARRTRLMARMAEEKLDALEKTLEARQAELAQRERQIDLKLQEVAGMSREEAQNLLLSRLDAELEEEKALRVKANLERIRLEVKREAQKLLAQAAQRQAADDDPGPFGDRLPQRTAHDDAFLVDGLVCDRGRILDH